MAKIQFSDVTPPEKRSIRDVPIPNSGRRKTPPASVPPVPPKKPAFQEKEESTPETPENKNSAYEYYYPKEKYSEPEPEAPKSHKKRWIFGVTALALILVFIIGMMTVFSSATINIVPKSQEVEVNARITATNEPQQAEAVRYEVVKLSKSNTVSVSATGEEAAEVKASGKIVIYNNFSTEPQRLIIRTRFESPEGLIYRIPESIVVPGKTVKDGVETPGSIEVEVFADEAGEKYNIKKSDFTIPGFKDDAVRYKTFFARSSTNMSGGFIGKMKTVLPADKQTAMQNIQSETEAGLKKDLESKVPEEMAMLPGSIVYKSTELPLKEDGSSVIIGKEVTAYAILLNASDLSKKLAAESLSGSAEWNGIETAIKDFSGLSISNPPANPESAGKLDLEIKGKTKIWAAIDTQKVSERLLGAPKKEAGNLINEFAGISSVTAAIRPIWKQSFPDNPAKIYIRTNLGE